NRDDVAAALEITAMHKAPVLPRGGGTSLAGQAVGRAVVIDFSKYMKRVLEVDGETRRARVGAGAVVGGLNRVLRREGLRFPPDPATASRCNIGGMIGNNSSGSRSIKYGKTSDYVHGLHVLLSGGESMYTAPLTALELDLKLQSQTREGAIYREALRLAEH